MGTWYEDGWNKIQPYVDPGNMLAGGPKQTDVGTVGGARPQDAALLQPVPGTNFSYDPVSGQYYQSSMIDPATGQRVDLGATQVAAAPNLANQTAGATVLQNMYVDQQNQALANAAATRAGQNQLGGSLGQTIAGQGTSVAGTQLQTGMNRIAADQNSMAAGASGQNAFAARRAAAQNTARAQGDMSGQAALLRAAETTAAQNSLAALYGQMSQADTAQQGIAAQTGLGYGNLAEEAESDRIGANITKDAEYNKQRASVLMGAGGAVSGIFGGGK